MLVAKLVMTIPKIIHHIAPKDKSRWHPLWEKCYNSWKEQFKDFEHILWNDESDIDNLIKEHYSDQFDFYTNLPVHIMRIDFARLCILHSYGGIYSDMDVFCYKNFYNELNEDFHIVEAPYGENWANGQLKVENCLMCSSKNNSFLLKMIDECEENYNLNIKNKFKKENISDRSQNYLIINTAGPSYVSNKMNNYNMDYKNILSGHLFNNHGLSYDKSFYTKHIMTGLWGKEIIDNITKESKNCFEKTAEDMFLQEIKKYAAIDIESIEEFDFYKDYTNGNYIKSYTPQNIQETENTSKSFQYN